MKTMHKFIATGVIIVSCELIVWAIINAIYLVYKHLFG